MNAISRRQFLRLGAISSLGLVIGIPVAKQSGADAGGALLHPLIWIGSDGRITRLRAEPRDRAGRQDGLADDRRR